MEPHRRGLYRRALCSRVYLAYSLRQLRVGISPPYTLNPYDRLYNVLQTPQIHTLCSYCPYPVILYCAFLLLTLSLQSILHLYNTVGTARSSIPISYLILYFQKTYSSKIIFLTNHYIKPKEQPNTYTTVLVTYQLKSYIESLNALNIIILIERQLTI